MLKRVLRVSEWAANLLSLLMFAYITVAILHPRAGLSSGLRRPSGLQAGQHGPIPDVDWGRNTHTLVLALQTTCRYCAESAPFYRELFDRRQVGDWQAVAVLPQPVGQARAYMRSEGYSVANVKQMDLGSIGVSGTPTLLLVDRRGRLEREWIGKLSQQGAAEVAVALGIGGLTRNQGEQASIAEVGTPVPLASARSAGPSGVLSTGQNASDAQSAGTRTVQLGRVSSGDPVGIIQVLYGDDDVTPTGRDAATGRPYKPWTGKPFQAGNDWLSHIVFVLKNFSDKELVAADLDVLFPETGAGTVGNAMIGKPIMLGRMPEHALYDPRTGRRRDLPPSEPLQLAPGQEMRVSLAPYYEQIRAAIAAKRPVAGVSICLIGLQMSYFADGSRWHPGVFEEPDPNVPGKYVRVTADEFRATTPIE